MLLHMCAKGAGAVLLFATLSAPLCAQEVTSPYAGSYVDTDNQSMQMEIADDEGLLRVRGGDSNFGYELACVLNAGKAACMGHGGKLEGEKFLYESVIEFAEDGTAIERWKAFNNVQSIDGASNWRRE